MTLPSSGPISMAMIANELGISSYGLSLNDSRVRNLAGRPSGTISFSDLRGKSAYTPMTLYAPNVYAKEADSRYRSGRAYANPLVTVSNGTAPYTYQWTMTSQSGDVLLENSTQAECQVSRFFFQNTNGSDQATLSCTVTDATGLQASVSNVQAYMSWAGSL